jgi:hypothetical protein
MFGSMRLGLHATGDSVLCPLALLALGMPTVESPAMMAVISEWNLCLICSFGFVSILQNCSGGGLAKFTLSSMGTTYSILTLSVRHISDFRGEG